MVTVTALAPVTAPATLIVAADEDASLFLASLSSDLVVSSL
jgi:hypothetical protein